MKRAFAIFRKKPESQVKKPILTLAELINAILSTSALVVAIFLFCQTKRQANISEDALKLSLKSSSFSDSVTREALKISLASLEETKTTNQRMQHYFEMENRPIISINGFNATDNINEKFVIDMTYENSGKTIAYRVKSSVNITVEYCNVRPIFKKSVSNPSEITNLVPSKPSVRHVDDSRVLTPETYDAFKNGSMCLYFWGEISYFDGFNKPHITKFCWKYDFKGKFFDLYDSGMNFSN